MINKENELNEFIFELYNLTYVEKQRVRDYFLSKEKIKRKKSILENYQLAIIDTIDFYLNNPINVEFTSTDFNLIVAKISLIKIKRTLQMLKKPKSTFSMKFLSKSK